MVAVNVGLSRFRYMRQSAHPPPLHTTTALVVPGFFNTPTIIGAINYGVLAIVYGLAFNNSEVPGPTKK